MDFCPIAHEIVKEALFKALEYIHEDELTEWEGLALEDVFPEDKFTSIFLSEVAFGYYRRTVGQNILPARQVVASPQHTFKDIIEGLVNRFQGSQDPNGSALIIVANVPRPKNQNDNPHPVKDKIRLMAKAMEEWKPQHSGRGWAGEFE